MDHRGVRPAAAAHGRPGRRHRASFEEIARDPPPQPVARSADGVDACLLCGRRRADRSARARAGRTGPRERAHACRHGRESGKPVGHAARCGRSVVESGRRAARNESGNVAGTERLVGPDAWHPAIPGAARYRQGHSTDGRTGLAVRTDRGATARASGTGISGDARRARSLRRTRRAHAVDSRGAGRIRDRRRASHEHHGPGIAARRIDGDPLRRRATACRA